MRGGSGVELGRQKTGETVREESGDKMFSLTSSLIRPVSLPNNHTAIRPDSTPTPTIPPGLHIQTLKTTQGGRGGGGDA